MICTLADSDPVALGENATVKLQLPPTATVPGQEFVRIKSSGCGPERLIWLKMSGWSPVFVSETVCAIEVVPTVCGEKDNPDGETPNVVGGGGGGCQIPVVFTTAGRPENRSVTMISPYELLPSAGAVFAGVGANTTEI